VVILRNSRPSSSGKTGSLFVPPWPPGPDPPRVAGPLRSWGSRRLPDGDAGLRPHDGASQRWPFRVQTLLARHGRGPCRTASKRRRPWRDNPATAHSPKATSGRAGDERGRPSLPASLSRPLRAASGSSDDRAFPAMPASPDSSAGSGRSTRTPHLPDAQVPPLIPSLENAGILATDQHEPASCLLRSRGMLA
jgi:hypothetical protein